MSGEVDIVADAIEDAMLELKLADRAMLNDRAERTLTFLLEAEKHITNAKSLLTMRLGK
ncbi:hypothetical protein D3C74_49550 [compost metagenome]